MKRLSHLQKKLSKGFEELRSFVSENQDLCDLGTKSVPVTGDWHRTRGRLAELEQLCEELREHEKSTGTGSVELYWLSRVNELIRQKVDLHLKGREWEFLGKAAYEIGRRMRGLVPHERLMSLMDTKKSEGELLKEWAAQSDENLRLLKLLEKTEEAYKQQSQQSTFWNIAVENAQAAVALGKWEESFLQGSLLHPGWRTQDDELLSRGWTLLELSTVEKQSLEMEEKLETLHQDFENATRLIAHLEDDSAVPHSHGETRDFAKKCAMLARKYDSETNTAISAE